MGFDFYREWIKKGVVFYSYVIILLQYAFERENHYQDIYEIIYTFNEPIESTRHDTFIDVFFDLFVNVYYKQQLSLYFYITTNE